MLKELSKNFEQDRMGEDKLITEALGRTMTFEEYLDKDKGYIKARKNRAAAAAKAS